MILDYGQTVMVGGVIAFPAEGPFVDEPRADIQESVVIMGSTTGTTISLGGSADQQEE